MRRRRGFAWVFAALDAPQEMGDSNNVHKRERCFTYAKPNEGKVMTMPKVSLSKRSAPRTLIATLGLVLLLVLSACSTGGSGGSGGSSGGSGMPANTAGPARATVKAGTGCGSNKDQHCPIEFMPGDPNRDAIVKAMVATTAKSGSVSSILTADQASPTTWSGPTAPVPVPSGPRSIVGIACSATLAGCYNPLLGAQEVAKKFGWSFKIQDGQENTSTINRYMLSAVSSKVDLILLGGLDPKTLQQGLEAAAKAKIPVISFTAALQTPNPVIKAPSGAYWPLTDVSANFVDAGRSMADYAIADSKGKGGILVLDDKEAPSQISLASIVDEVNKECPGCSTYGLTLISSDLATTFPQKLLAFIRQHPGIKYVMLPYDPIAPAIVPVLQQAGLTDVKIVGILGLAENLQYIRDGQSQTADAAWDNNYMGWAVMDQWFREVAGQPLASPAGEGIPQVLIDKSNVGTGNGGWATSIDYKSKYLQLWGQN